MSLPAAATALAGAQPMRGRLEVVRVEGGVTLLVDHQKNSAESVVAALTLAAEVPGRRVLVVARVRDSNAESEPALRAAGLLLVQAFDHVIAIGDGVDGLLAAGLAAGLPPERVQRAAPGAIDAVRLLTAIMRPGDLVLLKARIAWKLDRVVLALQGRDVACDLAYCGLIRLPCAECPQLAVASTGTFG
jgi:UDP-N-acetylmuramoyl-tripeptide--D-alanyl-D-alanine ligase